MEITASASKLAEKLDSAAKIQSFSLIFSKFRSRLGEALSEVAALKKLNDEKDQIIATLRNEAPPPPSHADVVDPGVREKLNHFAALTQEKEALLSELAQLKMSLDAKETAHNECKNHLHEAAASVKEKSRITELLQSRVTHFESQMEIFEKRHDAMQTDVREITKQFVQYKEYVAAVAKTQRAAAEKIQRLSDLLDVKNRLVQERDAAIKQLNVTVLEKDHAIDQQGRQLRILGNEVAMFKSSAATAQKKVEDMVLEKQKLLGTFTTLDESLADARAMIAKQQAASQARSNEYLDLKRRFDELQSAKSSDSARVRELEDYNTYLRAELERKLSELGALHAKELEDLQAARITLQQQLQAVQQNYTDTALREESLKIELSALRLKLEPLEERVAHLQKELLSTQERLSAADKEGSSLRSELDAARQNAAASASAAAAASEAAAKESAAAAAIIAAQQASAAQEASAAAKDSLVSRLHSPSQPVAAPATPAVQLESSPALSMESLASPRAQTSVMRAPSASTTATASAAPANRSATSNASRRTEEKRIRIDDVNEQLDDLSTLTCASCSAPSYGLMVSCQSCTRQFHASCVAVSSVESRYVCTACKASKGSASRGGKRAKTHSGASGANNDVIKMASFV